MGALNCFQDISDLAGLDITGRLFLLSPAVGMEQTLQRRRHARGRGACRPAARRRRQGAETWRRILHAIAPSAASVNDPKQLTCEDNHLRRIGWIGLRDRPVAVRSGLSDFGVYQGPRYGCHLSVVGSRLREPCQRHAAGTPFEQSELDHLPSM